MSIRLIFYILSFCFLSCNNSYETEESKAIEDISNDYLNRKDLSKTLNPPTLYDGKNIITITIDSLGFRIYFSDTLMSLSQVKQDAEHLFVGNNFNTSDSLIFYGLLNSEKFRELSYREFDKTKLKLIKPYIQLQRFPLNLKGGYKTLKFSRVCFDEKKQNGIVVIDYSTVFESFPMTGFHEVLLIKKKNNKWTYISN